MWAVNAFGPSISGVGDGGGGGSSGTFETTISTLGPSISGSTVFTIVLCFVLAALFVLTLFHLGRRSGHLDARTQPISKRTMRKYQQD